MTPKLSEELAHALCANSPDVLEVIDPATNRIDMIVDSDTYRQTLEALPRQYDRNAIAEGMEQMESGERIPTEQAFEELRERVGFPQTQ